jgi:hypothetical protein
MKLVYINLIIYNLINLCKNRGRKIQNARQNLFNTNSI